MSIPIVATDMDDYTNTTDMIAGEAAGGGVGSSNKRSYSLGEEVDVTIPLGEGERECKRRCISMDTGVGSSQLPEEAVVDDVTETASSGDEKGKSPSTDNQPIVHHINPFGLNNEPSFQIPTTSDATVMNPYLRNPFPEASSSSSNLFTVPVTTPPNFGFIPDDLTALLAEHRASSTPDPGLTPRPSIDRRDTVYSLHENDILDPSSLRPFPDIIPMEIIFNILDQVLSAPVFGGNGRWKDKAGQEEDKVRFVRELKRSASIYRRFSLVHPSWTPQVLRALYRAPTLTSKRSIEQFRYCLDHPLELWGTQETGEGTIGGVVGPRRNLVKFISYAVGMGRHSATDYLTYSGAWFAEQAGGINGGLPNSCGWETEGWCSKGCEEIRLIDFISWESNVPEESKIRLHRLNILRAPVPADVFHITTSSLRDLRAIELLDVQPHMVTGESLDLMKRTIGLLHTLEMIAIRVDGAVEQEGTFDDILELRPTLKYLQVQADLLSAGFFDRPRTRALESLLIGFTSTTPLVFNGKEAIDTLWVEAQRYYAFEAARRSIVASNTPAAEPDASENEDSRAEGSSAPSSSNLGMAVISSYPRINERSSTGPVLGLESWLLHELNLPDSPIAKAAITGNDALALADAWAYHNTLY